MKDWSYICNEDAVILAVHRWLSCTKASSAMKEGFVDSLLPAIRFSYCSKEVLEELSIDEKAVSYLKLKIFEHLQHGRHGGHTARPSYASTVTPRVLPVAAASSPFPSRPKPPPSPYLTPKDPLTTAPASPAREAATPGELEPETQEQILLVGGYEKLHKTHRKIEFVDSDSTLEIPHPFPDNKHYYSACSTGDGLIVSGGYDTSAKRSLSKVKTFSLKIEKWIDLPDLSRPNDSHGSVHVSNRFYTVGGLYREGGSIKCKYDAIEVLDFASLRWAKFSALPKPVQLPGVAHAQNQLLVFGGRGESGDWLRDTYSYDMTTRERRTCQQMPLADFFLRTTAAAEKHVYLLCYELFLQYDVLLDTWTKLASPIEPSSEPAMVLHKNKLVVLGGSADDVTSHIQTYDPATNKWRVEKRTMPEGLWQHWALVVKMPTVKRQPGSPNRLLCDDEETDTKL